ncbi:hypothetical protein LCGC14_2896200 [marine sediment metagenome]|uniref:Uncharacterized protein n=1 Tax=marine sediment metagenome TaxID=412755 RepID=A0A0F8XVR6_9ZZZZ
MSIRTGTAFQFLNDQCVDGNHDVRNDVLFFAMYSTLADIDPVTVDDQASITGELVGSGYTAGGVQLTQTIIYTPGEPERPSIDFDDLVFGPGATWGITNEAAQGAVIYNTTAGPQQNKVMWVINFGSPIAVNNGEFFVRWPDPTDPTLAVIRTSG